MVWKSITVYSLASKKGFMLSIIMVVLIIGSVLSNGWVMGEGGWVVGHSNDCRESWCIIIEIKFG